MMEYRYTFKYKIEIVDESLPLPKLISYCYNKAPSFSTLNLAHFPQSSHHMQLSLIITF